MKLSQGQKLMLFSVFWFSLMNVCVKALPRIPEVQIAWLRGVFALFICAYLLRRKRLSPKGKNQKLLFLRGIFGSISLVLYFIALQSLPLAAATTIQSLAPLFSLMLAALFYREMTTAKQWMYFFVAFLGIAVLRSFDEQIRFTPFLCALAASFLSAIAYTSVRGLRNSDHPYVVVYYFALIASIGIAPFALSNFVWPTSSEWLTLVAIGAFTQLGQITMTQAYHEAPMSEVGQLAYLNPLLGLLWGYVFFQEWIPFSSLLGLSLILFGVIQATRSKPLTKS